MAIGDSLTHGTTALSFSRLMTVDSDSYPHNLQGLLAARYRAQTIVVINEGVEGEEAVDGAQRLGRALRDHDPEVLLLMEGTNDLFFWREEAQDRAIPALEHMVQEAQDSGIRVFLATIPPQRPGGPRDAVSKLIPAFNNAIRALASRRGAVLVDIESVVLPDMSLVGNDDLHLTERGYQVVAEKFFAVIRGTLEIPSAAQHAR
jgi:lysophospholipase L1-like esterase